MKIEYNPYALKAKSSLNACSQERGREGALLRIHFADGLLGYADCHPWPELGDSPLSVQLASLAQGKPTHLLRCSLRFARLDAEARAQGRSLLEKGSIPSSHFLITDLLAQSPQDIDHIFAHGYTHVKVKLGRHLPQEIVQLIHLFSSTSLKLRLDFNETLSYAKFRSFLNAIDKVIDQIDFIEDPFPFDPIAWKEVQTDFSVRLACDRQVLAAQYRPDSAAVFILKPAIQADGLLTRIPHDKIIVTSYLDHPLGQVAAAYMAAQIDPLQSNIHGLLSHHAYQSNPFSQLLSWQGPQFIAPPGKGFGFDQQLTYLPWKILL